MPTKTSTPGGLPPTVLERPTLGYPVYLGELYDERRGQFLGVQLYDRDIVEDGGTAKVDSKYTELSLSMANSFDDKASLIDLNAELSVEILGGLISVKGSASYLNDSKANTQSRAWAMSLKMRLQEERLLFAEEKLGRNVLPLVLADYIAKDLATHFVSSIVYGGSVIVNLVARHSKLMEEEKIEGALEAELQKLKGLVDLNGKADIHIKDQFENLNDKFDVVLYGDIALPSVPANPQDVLDTLPDLSALISKDGGVPISVVLQPIPAELREAATIIHHIDQQTLEDILRVFGNLDDVSSRFAVLQDGGKKYNEYIPKFESATRAAVTDFLAEHRALLAELSDFVSAFKAGTKSTSAAELLKAADDLYDSQIIPISEDYTAPIYPTNLVGLELAYSNFLELSARLQSVGHELSTIKSISVAAGDGKMIPLFLMPPLSPHSGVDFLRFTALLRTKSPRYVNQDPPLPSYALYVETPATLEAHFPNDKRFAELKEPAIFVGQIDRYGTLSWTEPSDSLDARGSLAYDFDLHIHMTGVNIFGRRVTSLNKINTAKSFSVVVWAKRDMAHPGSATGNDFSEVLRLFDGKTDKLVFRNTNYIYVHVGNTELTDKNTARAVGVAFCMTFVQDAVAKKWQLYVDNQKISEKAMDSHTKLGELYLLEEYPAAQSQSWFGYVHSVQVYSDALTQVKICNAEKTFKSILN
ncbi:hypothetical protein BS17DRAFT_518438 [Gyrodon lividus]|nr:hypothetical protein BS17DRAFT_518438 [Gyrodon lividus]